MFEDFAGQLGDAFSQADAEKRILYGFVFHEVTTTYLGSSTGLRLRHVQPTGHYGCTGQERRADQQRLGRRRDPRLQRTSTAPGWRPTWRPASPGENVDVDLPAGRYDTILPPSAVADLVIDAYWSAGARNSADGQTIFSKPGGGTRIGEQMVNAGVRLHSDPSYAGLECAPFVVDRWLVGPHQRLRQRPAPRPDRLDPRRPAHRP